jgi:hypothetical protein
MIGYLLVIGLSAASVAVTAAASLDDLRGSRADQQTISEGSSSQGHPAFLRWPEIGAGVRSGTLRAQTSRETSAFNEESKQWVPIPAKTPILGIRQSCVGLLNSFTVVRLKGPTVLHIRASDIQIIDVVSQEDVSKRVTSCAPPQSLRWEDLKAAHEGGLVGAIVPKGTKAFDRRTKTWFDLAERTELAAIEERCAGWMKAFIQAGYSGRPSVYVREWDVRFTDRTTRVDLSDRLETCPRPRFTRDVLVAGQQEGLVQVFTNKAVPANGENGALVYVGPGFRNRQDFEIEWLSHSTSGLLKIPGNRAVQLENEPCKPVAQVRIRYAERTFRISASHLDIRIAGDNLAKTPLGPAFLFLCDEIAR